MVRLALVICCFPFLVAGQGGYVIEGSMHLSSAWAPVIYLSALDAIDDLSTVSDDMIIDHSAINADGSFRFAGNFLHEHNRIYRLHVSKVGDPSSTIIIGGREENHVHFAMAPGDTVRVTHRDSSRLFAGLEIVGNAANACMHQVDDLKIKYRHQQVQSSAEAKLMQGESRALTEEVLRNCSDPLGKLYAAHILLEKFEDAELIKYLLVLRRLTSFNSSPYFDAFDRRLEVAALNYNLSPSRISGNWLWLLIFPLLGVFWFWYSRQQRSQPAEAVMMLSFQERKVLGLLVNGNSNKEISSELNIGVSTVKSHVHRIYSKLGIQSRREVVRFKEFV